MPDSTYVGGELALFEKATRWKHYFARHLRRFLAGDVLEVGAGFGANTLILRHGAAVRRWVCLEPDPSLAAELRRRLDRRPGFEVIRGVLGDLSREALYDAIIYVDVLEHIEDDAGELARAANHLNPNGRLIVLAPAHSWLYSEFDAAIGHFRRYTRRTISALQPSGLTIEKLIYLDVVGLLASLGNRLILRSSLPTEQQVLFWDRWLVTSSRVLDPLVGHRLGKSVLAVMRRHASTAA